MVEQSAKWGVGEDDDDVVQKEVCKIYCNAFIIIYCSIVLIGKDESNLS